MESEVGTLDERMGGFAVWLNDFGKEAVRTHENIFLCYDLLVFILNMYYKIHPKVKNVTPRPHI